jgi:putative transposase
MKVTRTEQIYIRDNETISMMSHFSKNLYNQTNYILRQQFMKEERMSGYNDLVKQFEVPDENEENNNYQKLSAQAAEWTIKKVKQAWNSYFKALRAWKKTSRKFCWKAQATKIQGKKW